MLPSGSFPHHINLGESRGVSGAPPPAGGPMAAGAGAAPPLLSLPVSPGDIIFVSCRRPEIGMSYLVGTLRR